MLSALTCALFFFAGPNQNASLVFKPEKIYQAPSEDLAILEDPADVAFDNLGRLYILDSAGKALLVWDRDGRFIKTIGREGDGPGEFRFEDAARSELTFDGQYIVVWDDKAGKIQYFEDMEYVKTRKKPVGLGSVPVFECLKNGKSILWLQQTRNQKLYSRIILIDSNSFQEVKTLHESIDEMYKRNEKGGWDFYPYSKRPIIYADYYSDQIWLGNAVDPEVSVFTINGDQLPGIRLTLPPREHTLADRDLVMKHYTWLKPPNKAIFSSHKRLYDTIVPVSPENVLVSPYNVDEGFYNGYVYGSDGQVLGRFKQFFGDRGGIYFTNHQIIAFYNDERGNYSIKSLMASYQPD